MKRFLFLFLLIFISAGMTGCGQNNSRNPDSINNSVGAENFMAVNNFKTGERRNKEKDLSSAENYSLLPKLQDGALQCQIFSAKKNLY